MKLSQTIARTRSRKTIRGQGMSEYLIIVGLIAVAGIVVAGLFGSTVRSQLGGMAQELGGTDGGGAITQAQGLAGDAVTDAATRKDLGNYNGNNAG